MKTKIFKTTVIAFLAMTTNLGLFAKDVNLLNVSYDPTRELYAEYNKLFANYWKSKTGDEVRVNQSHGGSGKQARSVIDGLEADIVTLALSYDIDIIASKGLIARDWLKSLPNNSTPYTSTIVFVVRKGNPKNIKDWDDLVRNKVSVITPNPKTSGGARWNYLAAWAFAQKKFNNDANKVQDFIKTLYKNVPVLDSGARGSSNTFAQNGIGDVLLAWENESFLILEEFGKDKYEVVIPSLSILAEPPVAIVEKNAEKHGTLETAKAYLKSLYSEAAQEIIAKHGYRPRNPAVLKKYESKFPKLELITIDGHFGGWHKAQKDHFADGASFDQLYVK
ncbi:sulfate ABC transporter substrate-binding protein [Leptospira yasudae]|uniref:Sulfate-binding protein n=1 Tax=Leptospira yasudae TaxID=2202201 RepID=A0ABX9M4P4_9LEPT|nr:sulfate ABC transporter substrate-binding protein [Leptospira yasudae]MBW0434010.1 sulfate ABC transporter substrate-binding protein [Leptospira yasudae]RHX80524.1 sulfate ABC transporter substrate-binding protein [Leptospira yasudae]RHX94660.1 sulfate ABC transporter substrate-binding protein [Leptospira yasudae]TGK24410.1 sulfate ABC transporter substrate-binding protein [Leptospira yasudae]TGM05804.1 sulfate ABC transporter substrate-binding protein [Leptospira yasudae]